MNAFVAVSDLWEELEANRVLIVLSPSFFSNYLNIILSNFGDAINIWRIAMIKFVIFSPLSFLAKALNGFFFSKTLNTRVVHDGYGILMAFFERPILWIEEFGFFEVKCSSYFYPCSCMFRSMVLVKSSGTSWTSRNHFSISLEFQRRSWA